MNNNTSATGGTLVAVPEPDAVVLRRFLQGVFAAITEIPGNLVRPRWQRNPVASPDFDEDWMAFGITRRAVDGSLHVQHKDDTGSTVRYDETLTVLCSFYGPKCEVKAEMLRDGLGINQNRELMLLAGMGINSFGDILHVPEVANDQWVDRCDLELLVSREVSKLYKILSFGSAIGAIITETMTLPFEVKQP